jgi:hypothetical protein
MMTTIILYFILHIMTFCNFHQVLFWSMANKLAFPVSGLGLAPTSAYHGQGSAMNRYPVMVPLLSNPCDTLATPL